ncbi:MAG: electron transfer flavoprotein subunit beta/FixA family protein [Deltaproteobacteria bacterium]|nr:electron transfer flavoprotein subunit beta/FixA family protein [Deltaproteobacteria bacterium]
MEIIVLLKQVPSTESMIEIAGDGASIKTDGIKWVINPYDELAVEEALRIREAQGGSVTIVTVGREKAAEAVRTALAMGADKGVLVSDPALENADGLATAKVLAHVLKEMPYDLIIAGHRAVDDDNYLVGAAVADKLGLPLINMVFKEEVADGRITCHKTVDGGSVVVEAALPVLFTTQRGLNEPRYASLPGIMKAKKKPLDTKTMADLGLSADDVGAAKVRVVALKTPPERSGGKMIEGDTAADKAAALVKALHEEAKVI